MSRNQCAGLSLRPEDQPRLCNLNVVCHGLPRRDTSYLRDSCGQVNCVAWTKKPALAISRCEWHTSCKAPCSYPTLYMVTCACCTQLIALASSSPRTPFALGSQRKHGHESNGCWSCHSKCGELTVSEKNTRANDAHGCLLIIARVRGEGGGSASERKLATLSPLVDPPLFVSRR